MGADYSFELISIDTYAPQFIGHNIFFLGSVPQFPTAQQCATSNLCRFNTHELSSNGMVRRQEERIYSGFVKISSIQSNRCIRFRKAFYVHIFWEGHRNLKNLPLSYDIIVKSKQSWIFFQILWPSQKKWTLKQTQRRIEYFAIPHRKWDTLI